jgi:hypothetical protein
MPVDRVHGPVDHYRAVVYGSTVDHRQWWPKRKRKREPRGFLPWVRVGGAVLEGGRRWWTVMVVGWSSVRYS